jgi:hypothetical protein
MADLYNQVIYGDGVSTYTVGGNTERIFPTSEIGTPKITPVIINTNGYDELPSGGEDWAQDDSDADNYSITSDFQTQGDVFLAVRAVQQYCEVYEVGGSSGSNILTLMCRDSSIPYDDGTTFQDDGSTITVLQNAVRAALGNTTTLVRIGRIVDNDTVG